MYKCTLQTGFQSFTELDEVVQSLATGEIADSVREIASFRTKIKDIGSKVSKAHILYYVDLLNKYLLVKAKTILT